MTPFLQETEKLFDEKFAQIVYRRQLDHATGGLFFQGKNYTNERPANLEEIKSFLLSRHHKLIEHISGVIEGKKKNGNNGEGLPFENSPEIYGNQRVEAHKKGYNQALEDIKELITNLMGKE